jgi:hypothetical protein
MATDPWDGFASGWGNMVNRNMVSASGGSAKAEVRAWLAGTWECPIGFSIQDDSNIPGINS